MYRSRMESSDDGGGGYEPVGGKEGEEDAMTELTTTVRSRITTKMDSDAEYGDMNDEDDDHHESGEFVNAAAAAVIARKRNSILTNNSDDQQRAQ
mmetsp:Transcript_59795/g.64538  ORF Transcript_59795/g.64538 Transcript_59795/m.64538 type:complete len:95 (+) Transcript_59795:758-1042(+)